MSSSKNSNNSNSNNEVYIPAEGLRFEINNTNIKRLCYALSVLLIPFQITFIVLFFVNIHSSKHAFASFFLAFTLILVSVYLVYSTRNNRIVILPDGVVFPGFAKIGTKKILWEDMLYITLRRRRKSLFLYYEIATESSNVCTRPEIPANADAAEEIIRLFQAKGVQNATTYSTYRPYGYAVTPKGAA